jgi:hypothetical protein
MTTTTPFKSVQMRTSWPSEASREGKRSGGIGESDRMGLS